MSTTHSICCTRYVCPLMQNSHHFSMCISYISHGVLLNSWHFLFKSLRKIRTFRLNYSLKLVYTNYQVNWNNLSSQLIWCKEHHPWQILFHIQKAKLIKFIFLVINCNCGHLQRLANLIVTQPTLWTIMTFKTSWHRIRGSEPDSSSSGSLLGHMFGFTTFFP